MIKKDRVFRNYEISKELYEWLKEKAEEERRPVMRQVEVILERARKAEIDRGMA